MCVCVFAQRGGRRDFRPLRERRAAARGPGHPSDQTDAGGDPAAAPEQPGAP